MTFSEFIVAICLVASIALVLSEVFGRENDR